MASVILVMAVMDCICTIWFIISDVSAVLSMLWFWNCATINIKKSCISRVVLFLRLVLLIASLVLFWLLTNSPKSAI